MRYVALIPIISLWILPFSVRAQVFTVADAISAALVHNTEIQSVYLDRLLAINNLSVQQKLYRPKLSLEMKGTAHKESYSAVPHSELMKAYPNLRVKTPIGTQLNISTEKAAYYDSQKRYDDSVTITILQPLTRGAKVKVNNWPRDQAQLQYQAEMLNYQHEIENLVLKVILQFTQYQQKFLNIESQQKNLSQAERLLNTLNEKYHAGRIAKNDLFAPQLQIKQAKQSMLQAKNELSQARMAIFDLVGIEDNGDTIIADLSYQPSLVDEHIIPDVIAHDVRLKNLKLNETRYKHELILVKDNQMFDINLQADVHLGRSYYHQFEDITAKDGEYHALKRPNKGYTASINFSVPIGDGYIHHNKRLAIHTAIQKNLLEIKQRQRILKNQAITWVDDIILQRQQLMLTQEELDLSERDYQGTLEKYIAGRSSVHEVIRTQDRVHQVSMRLSKTELQLLEAKIRVEQATGHLLENWDVTLYS
tara:strand:+ start:45488 stop:46921 length:1434 start_codon:yes stop_codon:yes gene_type:complete